MKKMSQETGNKIIEFSNDVTGVWGWLAVGTGILLINHQIVTEQVATWIFAVIGVLMVLDVLLCSSLPQTEDEEPVEVASE